MTTDQGLAVELRWLSAMLSTILLLPGCAATWPEIGAADLPTSVTLPASFDRTWTALVGFISDRGEQIETIDRASGLVTIGRVSTRDFALYAHPPKDVDGAWAEGRYAINCHAVSVSDSTTTLKITATVEGYDSVSRAWCWGPSRGYLETRLILAVRARLDSTAAAAH